MKGRGHVVSLYLRDLLFPPRCAGCGERLVPFDPARPALCPLCRTAWEAAGRASGLPGGGEDPAAGVYLVPYHPEDPGGVPQQVIYHIKHRDDSRVFDWLATRLAQAVTRQLEAEGIPLGTVILTYPPRRRAAVRREGFDQARRLAVCLSRRLGAPCLSLIRRPGRPVHGAGREQKKLDAAQRKTNAAASYVLSGDASSRLSGRFVVLVDDLYTTGATLSACSALLTSAGASGVLWATVARTASRK